MQIRSFFVAGILCLTAVSCSQKNNSSKSGDTLQKISKSIPNDQRNLHEKTIITSKENGQENKTEVISDITAQTFRINLEITQEEVYVASLTLEEYKKGNDYRYVNLLIVNERGLTKEFSGPPEFIQFMSKRGYMVVSEIQKKSFYEYTFSKSKVTEKTGDTGE